jgi:hypothetical protein
LAHVLVGEPASTSPDHALDGQYGRNDMEIDIPEVAAEVKAAFDRYEQALVANDVATLDQMFRNDPTTIRYGAALAGRPDAYAVEDGNNYIRA